MNKKTNFINQSFKRQIFFVFLAITLALVIGGGILTLRGFQARIKSDYEKQDIQQDKLINEHLLNAFQLSETTMAAIEANQTLRGSFTDFPRDNQKIYEHLYNETSLVRDFATVDLYANGNCIFSTSQSKMPATLPLRYSVLKEAFDNPGKTVYSLDPNNAKEDGASLLLARQISGGIVKGTVVIRIKQDDISKILSGNINSKDGFILANSYMRPYCQLGMAKDGALLSKIRDNFIHNRLYTDGISSNVYMNELGETGLVSIYITPQPLEQTAINAGYQIVLFLAVFSVVVCFIVASGLSEYFSRPILSLTVAMKRFRKGDFDTTIELNRVDEFEQLANGFNKMTTQLKNTMEEQVAAERKINETRIAMMQAQLNPHFLYNTLDTIKWVAKANQVPEVATLSASLAGILRTSISEKQFCTLERELKLVENYCDIQKIRFDDRFELQINVPENLLKAVVPKLILQPLVENAIIHGMEEMDDGKLMVEAYLVEDDLTITITDNGKGISDEMIQVLESDDLDSLEGHLGLNNVNTIVKLYYGKDYGISAKRLEEGGTKIMVVLPFNKEEENND